MLSWSGKRKFIYGGTVIVLLAVAIAIPAWNIFYKAPTCFDGLKNGNELGIDCGGSCTKLCPSAFIPPSNVWTRFEQTAPGLYNVAAYIINPNTEGEAFDVPYHVDIYDTNGIPITKYDSTVTLPPNRNTVAFRSSVNVGNSIPSKAVFQFTGIPDWQKQPDGLSKVTVLNKSYSETDRQDVCLRNSLWQGWQCHRLFKHDYRRHSSWRHSDCSIYLELYSQWRRRIDRSASSASAACAIVPWNKRNHLQM